MGPRRAQQKKLLDNCAEEYPYIGVHYHFDQLFMHSQGLLVTSVMSVTKYHIIIVLSKMPRQ